MIKPYLKRPHPIGNGIQKLYRFRNGYGASVVQFSYGPMGGSYGAQQDLWELAVIKFNGVGDDYELDYDTPITDDVIGNLSPDQVELLLAKIRNL